MKKTNDDIKNNSQTCFVIMPISDPETYENGHFRCVYEDIFCPAIEAAGYVPKRADDDKSSSMIQVNIIKDIIEAPMAICDLSTRNPNVLFELGIRQAFGLPVVLVQEEGTPRIFDISTINTVDYRKKLNYREVLEDREKIASAIKATTENNDLNSIIRLLDITQKAELKANASNDKDDIKVLLLAMTNEIQQLKNEVSKSPKVPVVSMLESLDVIQDKGLTPLQELQLIDYLAKMNSTMRVYEIAKTLNVSSDYIVSYLNKKGIHIENHMSRLTLAARDKLMQKIVSEL